MGQQIVHRLLISFPALLGVLFLCFCLLQVVPADPAMIIAGPDAKAETIAAIRLELGLDRSIPIQFFEYILRVLRGDLGRSIISNRMVSEELAMTIGPTVELMLGGMLIAVPSGLALGTLAAVNRGRLSDRVIMACSVAGVSMPVFFIGLILIQYVGFKWGLLPFTGRTGPVWDGGLPSLILPALTLGAVLIGPIVIASSSLTIRLEMMERPRSPRSTRRMYSKNWTGIDLSRPSSWRMAAMVSAFASGPAMIIAGSAGTTCNKQKQRKRTPSKAGNEISKRWTICFPMRRQRTR